MPKYATIEKYVKTTALIIFLYGVIVSDNRNFPEDKLDEIIKISFLLSILTMVFLCFLYYLAGVWECRKNPLFSEFLRRSGKNTSSFMLGPNIYYKDILLWLALYGAWLSVLSGKTPFFFSFILLLYPFISVFSYAETETASLKEPDDSPQNQAKAPPPWVSNLKSMLKDLPERESVPEPEEEPAVKKPAEKNLTAQDLTETAEHLETFILLVEDKTLAGNIKSIVQTIRRIAAFTASEDNGEKTWQCLYDTYFYAEEFYDMLINYDEISNSSLRMTEGAELMQSIAGFAGELESALIKIFETAVSPELLESKTRLSALRQEMKIKGLIE